MNSRTLIAASGALLAVGALAVRRRARGDIAARRIHATRSATIRRDPAELLALFRDPAQLPSFFAGLEAVEAKDGAQRWTFAVRRRRIPVELEIVEDAADRFAWRTRADAPFQGGGSLTMSPAPGNRGTEARLTLFAEGPAAGPSVVARILGAPLAHFAADSLRRFKALAETGEIPRAEAS